MPACRRAPRGATRTPRGRTRRGSQRRLSERRQDQLHRQDRGAVLVVEDRVDLGDLERAEGAAGGDAFHQQVGFAVGDAAAYRRADAGSFLRVDAVHVEAHVHRALAVGDDRQRFLDHGAHAEAVDVGHRVRLHAELADDALLALVDVAQADEHHARRVDRVLLQREVHRHPVYVAGRRGQRRVDVAVRVDPDHPGRLAARPPDAGDRAHRDRVVAAEHQRKRALRDDVVDDSGQLVADRLDDREVLRVLLGNARRLGDRDAQVAVVGHRDAELLQRLLQPRVADRRGTHVDAAAVGAQVHRHADDVDARDRLAVRDGSGGGSRDHAPWFAARSRRAPRRRRARALARHPQLRGLLGGAADAGRVLHDRHGPAAPDRARQQRRVRGLGGRRAPLPDAAAALRALPAERVPAQPAAARARADRARAGRERSVAGVADAVHGPPPNFGRVGTVPPRRPGRRAVLPRAGDAGAGRARHRAVLRRAARRDRDLLAGRDAHRDRAREGGCGRLRHAPRRSAGAVPARSGVRHLPRAADHEPAGRGRRAHGSVGVATGGRVSSSGAAVSAGFATLRGTGGGSRCSRSTRIIAATGTARNVPIRPNISLPPRIAITIQNGERPTFSLSTRGATKLPSIWWITKIRIATSSACGQPPVVNARITAGTNAISAPAYGMKFSAPDTTPISSAYGTWVKVSMIVSIAPRIEPSINCPRMKPPTTLSRSAMIASAFGRFFAGTRPRKPSLMFSASSSMYAASTGTTISVASTETVASRTLIVFDAG